MRNSFRAAMNVTELRTALSERRERVVFVILRNLIPILGILFLGWSAQNLIVLYFADTLGAMWALVTGLALNFPEAQLATTLWGRVKNFGMMLFVGGFLIAFMAIPLGMPLLIYLMMVQWSWQSALADNDFVFGLLLIVALAFVGMFRQAQEIARLTPEHSNVKFDFSILMTRWVIILLLIYLLAFFLGPWGAYLLVLGYAGATVASEIFPERFANLFGREKIKRGG